MKKKVTAIVQARVGSSRLPGKVLTQIFGKELLYHLVENLKRSKYISDITILTSKSPEDKKIIKFCKLHKINYFTGALDNTFLRFRKFLLKNKNIKLFIRISGDSPLLDYQIIDNMIIQSKNKNFDVFTNIFPRSFPKGQSVEIINTKKFLSVNPKLLNKSQREHVTKYFYSNYDKFKIINYLNKMNLSEINLSIDTKKDLIKIKKIFYLLRYKSKNLKNIIKILNINI